MKKIKCKDSGRICKSCNNVYTPGYKGSKNYCEECRKVEMKKVMIDLRKFRGKK